MTEPAEVLAIEGNYAVVHVPGRNFPALAIHGDSLSVLEDSVRELTGLLAAGDVGEAWHALEEVSATVRAMLATYEQASRDRGFKLPYYRPRPPETA
ncbi:hypothetical protein SUDANB95_06957 [Actinosynnema sp. ALI-1.44]